MRCIVLTGPKHSGKTSVGKALAALLSEADHPCECIDLDDYIEQKNGISPRALYIEGPAVFRKAETEALAALLAALPAALPVALPVALLEPDTSPFFSSMVIASGGGLADNPDALAVLAKNTSVISVFLDVSAETAWQRIAGAGELPPFLNTVDPQKTHHSLHERRSAVYRRLASFVITADGKSPQEIAREIMFHP